MKEITETCPKCEGLCEIQVVETLAPKPKNIRIGCVTHFVFLPECFSSPDEAIDAWNQKMKKERICINGKIRS